MNRIKYLSLFFGFFAALILSACQTGSGYSAARVWNYPSASAPAQQAPSTLSDTTQTTAEQPANVQKAAPMPPVKVALLLPLSGQHQALGQAMLNAAQLALFDVAHDNFELLPHDTGGTADGARNAARAVLAQGADLILGPVFADSVRAVKPIAQRARVSVIAFSTDWATAGDNTYIMGFLPFDQVERLARYTSQHNTGRVAILAPRNDYGRVVTSAWQSTTSRLGTPPAQVTEFSQGESNLAPVLRDFTAYDERVRIAGEQGVSTAQLQPPFDAVLMPVGGETALSIGNLLNHYDLSPRQVKRLGTGLFDDDALATEGSLNGAWFAAPSPKLRKTFEQRYMNTYSASAPRLASLAYDATALAAVLAQRGFQTSGQADFSATAIGNPNGFAGIDGIFRFRSNGTAERGLAILEFNNGKIRVLDDAPQTFQNLGY
ncbi:MAG: penicillin-binding protein activator [Alphaproteobacteria bacterium]|nr:penicillin-binding protein activator [Alphaproteobacteria bacterium]